MPIPSTDAPPSAHPFRLEAQQEEGLMTSPPPLRSPKMTISHSDSKKLKNGAFMVTGPFWSDASKAWRVEFYQNDKSLPGGFYQGSFYCSAEFDAIRLAEEARKVKSREEWLNIRGLAIELAAERRDGFIYRVMAGECETFIRREGIKR
jgi:hypothetical protein